METGCTRGSGERKEIDVSQAAVWIVLTTKSERHPSSPSDSFRELVLSQELQEKRFHPLLLLQPKVRPEKAQELQLGDANCSTRCLPTSTIQIFPCNTGC